MLARGWQVCRKNRIGVWKTLHLPWHLPWSSRKGETVSIHPYKLECNGPELLNMNFNFSIENLDNFPIDNSHSMRQPTPEWGASRRLSIELPLNFSWNFHPTEQNGPLPGFSGKLLEAYSGVMGFEPSC